jgi:hypothetical protein
MTEPSAVIPDYRMICADCGRDNGPVSKVKYAKNKMPILPVCQCERSLFRLIDGLSPPPKENGK